MKTDFKNVNIVQEGHSDVGEWSVATLEYQGEPCVALRWKSPETVGVDDKSDWFILPEQFAGPVLNVARTWDPEDEESIRRGYEELAAYEASTDDPYPYDLSPLTAQREDKAA